ncbi:hypothetical protein AB6735_17335 [Mucilaginibacter sp. RCC_168]|uniref:LA_2272 family surface repeat-containing protein n=1 Tax=Mucilaginibacter sp. RCC_168 TaxID=3239221 RepID=UPI003523921A
MNFYTYNDSLLLTILKIWTFFLIVFVGTNAQAQDHDRARTNVGLVYPLSSNWTKAPRDTNSFSLNLIAGVSAAERGVTIAGFSNIIHNDARGFQIAGFSNHVGKNADGTMVAGFLNTYGGGHGVAVAGFANIAANSSGAQIAGFLNKGGNVSTLQLAGFMNIARDNKGTQIAGFMNLAKKSRGTQIGFINIADSAGTQIGIINIAKNGEKSFGATIDENQTALLTFRSGGKVFYGIVGVGYNFNNKKQKYAYEAGFGAHVLTIQSFRLNTELVNGGLESFKDKDEYWKSTFRLMPSFRIANKVDIFAGPSINYVNTNTEEGRKLTTKYINSWTRHDGRDLHGFYVGYMAGIQVAL